MIPGNRILIVAESATFAHPARSARLGELLSEEGYEVHFATAVNHLSSMKAGSGRVHSIHCIETKDFLNRLDRNQFFYSYDELKSQLAENQNLLSHIQPDLVISDFRLTMPMACTKAGIPCLNLTDFHWSSLATPLFPVPDNATTRRFGYWLSSLLARPVAQIQMKFWHRALNRLRKEQGLPLYTNLRQAYSDGDFFGYVGFPLDADKKELPPNHLYVGPLIWHGKGSKVEMPPRSRQHLILLSLGSSGYSHHLHALLSALTNLDADIIYSAPWELMPKASGLACFHQMEFIPINQWLPQCDLIIGNGGSSTVWAALSAGKPYLAVYSNFDQALNVARFKQLGVLEGQSTLNLRPKEFADMARAMLNQSPHRLASLQFKRQFELLGGEEWTKQQFRRFMSAPQQRKSL